MKKVIATTPTETRITKPTSGTISVEHCMKSIHIRNFFWPEYMEIRTRKSSIFGHFLRSGTAFGNDLTDAYEKIVHWKRNLFMMPSDAAGKTYVEEITHLLKLWLQDSLLKPITLKVIHVMAALLL